METVSVVIVSMNKLSNLDICLPSIERYTKVTHKIYVVAYMFNPEGLEILKKRYPFVTVIESNIIRGFSENNNLALKNVNTDYTFILNDDTEFKTSVIDKLLESLNKTPDASLISPVLYRGDGSLQFCGRGSDGLLQMLLGLFFHKKHLFGTKYENGTGIFKTKNISGAAFLIKTKVFRKMGFFDEKYFFCPEDIALSTKMNENGYYCYVDADVPLTHYEGVSSKKSKLFHATSIAANLGACYFNGYTKIRRYILLTAFSMLYIAQSVKYCLTHSQGSSDYKYIYRRVIDSYRKNVPTKTVFIEEYNKIICKNEVLY